ncbi:hypothetical protein [Streptomyces sp. NPDC054940]
MGEWVERVGLGLHEVLVTEPVRPDPSEIAWYGWLTEPELTEFVRREAFVPDAREAFTRYRALSHTTRPHP